MWGLCWVKKGLRGFKTGVCRFQGLCRAGLMPAYIRIRENHIVSGFEFFGFQCGV